MSLYTIVTGAAGFIGSNIVRALNDRGVTNIIAALTALISGACVLARVTVTPAPSSHGGVLRGPAVHCTGIWAVRA